MKSHTKLTFLATFVVALGTTATYADDQQLQNRLALRRAQSDQHATIAVYSHRGLGRYSRTMEARRGEPRFEVRTPPRGQQFGTWIVAK